MIKPPPLPEQSPELTEKIRTGEYYREALHMYDSLVHDPMAERYFYVLITILSGFILLITFVAMQGLYPLQTPVPFIYSINDVVEDVPRIQTLLVKKGEDPSEALLRFIVENYVMKREEYNIDTIDSNMNGIKAQSTPEVFTAFQNYVDPQNNPESPINLYQRHSMRKIAILSSKRLSSEAKYGMEILFEATVESKNDTKKSRWQANIAFNYSGLTLDESTGKAKPVDFLVTQYDNKRLQDIK